MPTHTMAPDAPSPISRSAAAESTPPTRRATEVDPDQWVDQYGDYLYAYAMGRLRDPGKAQDAVQEALIAALKNQNSYQGKSGERAWLVGILKHKILDGYRRHSRESTFTDLGFYDDEESHRFERKGWRKGAWIHALGPSRWSTPPENTLDRKEFWQTLYHCASQLPDNTSKAFLMREVDGVSCREICATLNVSENHLWVMLHRARMALRSCLETHWFRLAK